MKKILSKIIEKIYIKKCKKEEKKLLVNIKEKLTNEEKNKINKINYNIAKIVKHTYKDFSESNISYLISDAYFQEKLLPKLNDVNYGILGIRHKYSYFTDKNFQEKFAPNFNFPNAIIRKINGDFYSKDFKYVDSRKVLDILNKYDKVVFKKSLGEGHGRGVALVDCKDYTKVLKEFGNNYVVQELINQHEFLSSFNSSSVNIIRVTSLYLNGKVYILGCILRVGAPGAFCDHLGFNGNSPRIVAIDDNGNLYGNAIDPDNCIIYDDIFGKEISGKIPCYEEIIELVKCEHLKFIHHKIIGWDITVSKDKKVICIEFNSNVPGIVQTQMICGPIFSKLSSNDIPLLDEIIKNEN